MVQYIPSFTKFGLQIGAAHSVQCKCMPTWTQWKSLLLGTIPWSSLRETGQTGGKYHSVHAHSFSWDLLHVGDLHRAIIWDINRPALNKTVNCQKQYNKLKNLQLNFCGECIYCISTYSQKSKVQLKESDLQSLEGSETLFDRLWHRYRTDLVGSYAIRKPWIFLYFSWF